MCVCISPRVLSLYLLLRSLLPGLVLSRFDPPACLKETTHPTRRQTISNLVNRFYGLEVQLLRVSLKPIGVSRSNNSWEGVFAR